MNPIAARALVTDAFFQVLDNRVFRILAVLVLVPILASFLVAFREEHVSILFGVKRIDYDDIFAFFGTTTAGYDVRAACVDGLLQVLIGLLGGTFGVLFCIAATSFFVPRMIEKGAADVLFHKPLSRLVFFVAQYVAGLLFVGILAFVLVAGVYLGLLTMSGYSDLGIFWSAPTLIYLFGLIYPISMLIGVLTRSTVASLLLTILFFFGNGCIHNLWISKETYEASLAEVEGLDGEADEEANATADGDDDERSLLVKVLVLTLDVFHYALPKTTDTDLIMTTLRRSSRSVLYEDEETGFTVLDLPEGYDERPVEEVETGPYSDEVLALLGQPFLAAGPEEGETGATLTLRRRPRRELESSGRSTSPRTERHPHLGSDLKDLLENEVAVGELERFSESLPSRGKFGSEAAVQFRWVDDDGKLREHVWVTAFDLKDDMFVLEMRVPEEHYDEETFEGQHRDFTRLFGVEAETPGANAEGWYPSQFGWSAPLRYNAWFSIASSLAFVVVVLGLGWIRLARIDF